MKSLQFLDLTAFKNNWHSQNAKMVVWEKQTPDWLNA